MADALDPETIQPGSRVNIEIVKEPSSTAATKTLCRILSKDAEASSTIRTEKFRRHRASTTRTRAGRPWPVAPPKLHYYRGHVGESGTVKASVDVIKDLASVKRFVSITPAD